MGALKTCCGLYCAMTSLVGIYFFIIIAIMEWKGNHYLKYSLQVERLNEHPEENMRIKGNCWIICAAINVVFTGLCYWCGMSSIAADQAIIEKEKAKQLEIYQRIENQNPNQIVS